MVHLGSLARLLLVAFALNASLVLAMRMDVRSEGLEQWRRPCASNTLFMAGPCHGFGTLTSVRKHLWAAWDKCANMESVQAKFNATGYGRGAKVGQLSGQTVVVEFSINKFGGEPLRFATDDIPPAPRRPVFAKIFGKKDVVRALPKSFSSMIGYVDVITTTSFKLQGKGSFVASSKDTAEAQLFLETLTACAILQQYGMMPQRKDVVKARMIVNLEEFTYGGDVDHDKGWGRKQVPIAFAPEYQPVSRPWADVALRMFPRFRADRPAWLWGSGDRVWWPPFLRFSAYMNAYDGYCRSKSYEESVGCSAYMIGMEGTAENGEPLTLALFANIMHMDELLGTEVPTLVVKRGAGDNQQLFSIGFTSSAQDKSEASLGEKYRWTVFDDQVTVQLPWGKTQTLECNLFIDINLDAQRATVSLQQHSNKAKHTELTSKVCNMRETFDSGGAPALFFYSGADALIRARAVEEYIRNSTAEGQVQSCRFEGSHHVRHFERHRERYVAELSRFASSVGF